MTATEVVEWMNAARAGDREAFGCLYDHYVQAIYRYVSARVGDRRVAEDVTAETFTRALGRIGAFSWQGRDPGAWLQTIAHNVLRDRWKSSAARCEVLTEDYLVAEVGDRRRTDYADPADLATSAKREHEMRMAILRLASDDQREAMLYRYVDALPVAEAAAVMGRRVSTVKSLCHRAAALLRRDPTLLRAMAP